MGPLELPPGGGLRLGREMRTIGLGARRAGREWSEMSTAALSRGSAGVDGLAPVSGLGRSLWLSRLSLSLVFSPMRSVWFFSNSLMAFLSNCFLQFGQDSFSLIQSSRHSEWKRWPHMSTCLIGLSSASESRQMLHLFTGFYRSVWSCLACEASFFCGEKSGRYFLMSLSSSLRSSSALASCPESLGSTA